MALNTSRDAVIDARRRKVAALRLRRLTQREIVEAMAEEDFVNPDTGEPWSLGIVNRDLKALKDEWQTNAQSDLAQLRGEHHAEIVEARRVAWQEKKLYYVFEGLRQEADLLGLKLDGQRDLSREADAFLSGVHTVKRLQAEQDLSE